MKECEAAKLRKMRADLLVGLSKSSHDHYTGAFNGWMRYCERIKLTTWRDCDVDVAVGWIGWLRKTMQKSQTIRSNAVFPLRCVERLQQLHPEDVSPQFVIPYAQLPVTYLEYREEVLSEDRLSQIMECCVRDVESTKVLTRATLVPFLVLFCDRTGMNVDSVLNLPRDCTVETDGGHYLYWQKNRSLGSMRDFYAPADWGAVEIVDALRTRHSNPLVFSYDNRVLPLAGMSSDVRAWCRSHGLREFTLSEIRSSKATLIYQESGGNVAEVQRFLHHVSLATTMVYLSENVTRPINERLLAEAQEAMLTRWGIPEEGDL